MTDLMRDPAPDPELQKALGALDEPSLAEVNWERLQASIRDRAELPLARQRRTQRSAARWLRPAVPIAAAAGFALAVATGVFQSGSEPTLASNGEVPASFHPVVEEVLGSYISEYELDLLFGEVSAEMLVVAALDP
jgi:hypothetical protein